MTRVDERVEVLDLVDLMAEYETAVGFDDRWADLLVDGLGEVREDQDPE